MPLYPNKFITVNSAGFRLHTQLSYSMTFLHVYCGAEILPVTSVTTPEPQHENRSIAGD